MAWEISARYPPRSSLCSFAALSSGGVPVASIRGIQQDQRRELGEGQSVGQLLLAQPDRGLGVQVQNPGVDRPDLQGERESRERSGLQRRIGEHRPALLQFSDA
ncbi:hypothetical protein RB200_07155 [Streptomyces sp. PmtG]